MQDKQRDFILAAIRYYAGCLRMKVKVDDPIPIGLPLQFYFPQLRTAIAFSDFGENRHIELLKDQLCQKYEIDLIRILTPGVQAYPSDSCLCIQMMDLSEDTISATISGIFAIMGYDVDTDTVRDHNAIRAIMEEE